MNYSAEQVINGLISYADNEVMGKLPTTGKWFMGTGIALASNKVSNVVDAMIDNTIVKMLGIVDEDRNIDVDTLISAMKESAEKYGKLTVNVPLVGNLTFSSDDVERLKNYIRWCYADD